MPCFVRLLFAFAAFHSNRIPSIRTLYIRDETPSRQPSPADNGLAVSLVVTRLLLRMRVFSDKREVEERIGEVLVGQGGIGKHAGARMAFPNRAGTFLIGFQM